MSGVVVEVRTQDTARRREMLLLIAVLAAGIAVAVIIARQLAQSTGVDLTRVTLGDALPGTALLALPPAALFHWASRWARFRPGPPLVAALFLAPLAAFLCSAAPQYLATVPAGAAATVPGFLDFLRHATQDPWGSTFSATTGAVRQIGPARSVAAPPESGGLLSLAYRLGWLLIPSASAWFHLRTRAWCPECARALRPVLVTERLFQSRDALRRVRRSPALWQAQLFDKEGALHSLRETPRRGALIVTATVGGCFTCRTVAVQETARSFSKGRWRPVWWDRRVTPLPKEQDPTLRPTGIAPIP